MASQGFDGPPSSTGYAPDEGRQRPRFRPRTLTPNPSPVEEGTGASPQAARHDVADVRRQRRSPGDAPQHRLGMAPADLFERAPGSHCGEEPGRDLRIGG